MLLDVETYLNIQLKVDGRSLTLPAGIMEFGTLKSRNSTVAGGVGFRREFVSFLLLVVAFF